MSTYTLPGFVPVCATGRYELAMLAGEIVWFALHMSSVMLAAVGMFWSYRMIGVVSDPLLGLELFVILSAMALYLVTATAYRLMALTDR